MHIRNILHYFCKAVLLLLFIVPVVAFSQTPRPVPADYSNTIKVNYIRSWDAKAPEQSPATLITRPLRDVLQTTQYFDGLGRPLQTVVEKGSMVTNNTPVDLVSMTEYDAFGREAFKYLPTPATTSDGVFKLNPFSQQSAFYTNTIATANPIAGQGETFYYGQTNFEASPLNRVQETFAPGNSWAGTNAQALEANRRSVKIKYYVNTLIDDVKIWTVTNGATLGDWGSYAKTGEYAAGTLYKTITVDEHNKQVIEFKDKEGRVILKKVQLTAGVEDDGTGEPYTGYLCTYYIYDDLGNLRCVVPPEATRIMAQASNWDLMGIGTGTLLERQCFCYEYDGRNRMIMKKVSNIPRADAVYMVYDQRDRLVMTQDGKQRKAAVNVWMATLYDNNLNRPLIRGFCLNGYFGTKTYKQHLADAANSIEYPFAITAQPSVTYWSILTQWGYDNYVDDFPTGTGLTTTLDNTYTTSTYLNTTYNTSPLYAQQPVQSLQTRGLVTWTKTLMYGIGTYYYTVNIYDDKGRVIQTKSTNITGGIDITTTQYDWAGKPLRIVQKQQLAGSGAQTSVMLTDITYDDLGRPTQTQKKLQNTLLNNNITSTPWTTINKNQYDALGQLKNKTMGNRRDNAGVYTAAILSNQDYAYNIRGWLLSINKAYTDASGNTDQYFAFELGYDKDPSLGTYTTKQYNGNISSMLWKSAGDQQRRKYNFVYDNANRLTDANFGQWASGSGNSALFDVSAGVDFSEYGLTYDYNGNIKTLNRKGLILNASPVIDQLTYSYYSYDNRPYKVADAGTNTATNKLGDFQDGTNTSDDYNYSNGNGSLTTDANKGITNIEYWRTAELPKIITTAKGTISYTHDDAGNKLRKITVENPTTANGSHTITTTTTYLGGFVYESKTTSPVDANSPDYSNRLLFAAHEEGRIRPQYNNAATPNTPTGFVYDYFLKDHLGNIRMVLTDEYKQDIYPAATLEGSLTTSGSPNAAYIEKNYYNIDATKIVPQTDATGITAYPNNNGTPVNPNPNSNTTANSAKLYKLNSGTNKTGLGITLKVMAGDRIDIFGKSYYFQNNTGGTAANSTIPVLDIITGLLGGPTGGIAASAHGGVTATQLNAVTATTGGINTLLTNQTTNAALAPTVPKAYINYIFFDERFASVASGFSKVGSNSVLKPHTDLSNITVPKNGYVYIYVSNESPVNVFFDNLQVVHTRGAIMEETHYYPFGLTMAGISSKALNGIAENKYRYNSGNELQNKEFSDGSGLDWYDATFRMYDAQIGRFHQVDLLADIFDDQSPYSFAYNNPLLFNDPLGLASDTAWKTLPEVIIVGNKPSVPPSTGFIDSEKGRNPFTNNGEARVNPAPAPVIEEVPKLDVKEFAPPPPPNPWLLRGIGTAVLTIWPPLSAGAGSDIPSYYPYARIQMPSPSPYTGHGNNIRNTNSHIVYYFTYDAKPGQSTILKYGISDELRNSLERPERQLGKLRSKYGASVNYNIYIRTNNREQALFVERLMVTQHVNRWSYKPIEQDRPDPF